MPRGEPLSVLADIVGLYTADIACTLRQGDPLDTVVMAAMVLGMRLEEYAPDYCAAMLAELEGLTFQTRIPNTVDKVARAVARHLATYADGSERTWDIEVLGEIMQMRRG